MHREQMARPLLLWKRAWPDDNSVDLHPLFFLQELPGLQPKKSVAPPLFEANEQAWEAIRFRRGTRGNSGESQPLLWRGASAETHAVLEPIRRRDTRRAAGRGALVSLFSATVCQQYRGGGAYGTQALEPRLLG